MRHAEYRHDAVAHETYDSAAVVVNDRHDPLEVAIEKCDRLLGAQMLAAGSVTTNVREQNASELLDASRRGMQGTGKNRLHHRGADVAVESTA